MGGQVIDYCNAYQPRAPKQPGVFKVGDRVKVVAKRMGHYGQVGRVVPRKEGHYQTNPHHVEFPGGESPSYQAGDLEHA